MRICPGVPTQSLSEFPFVRIAHAPQGFAGSGAIIPDVASGRRLLLNDRRQQGLRR
jgi:hypothetical protein